MKPNLDLITISDNENKIIDLLSNLVLKPRIEALKWSKLTRQTPNIKIGYPGQHLASLITGMKGEGTGARGNDLVDGSEVKSCSRIDQADKCLECKSVVTRFEMQCPNCGSKRIQRNNDSKWLFTIRNKTDLETLLVVVNRVLLLISDYPNFEKNDFETIRFQAFEIWTKSDRQKRFGEIMTNYYENIYLEHKRENQNKTPAPKNFWPYSYQFYVCNPIKTFECIVTNANEKPEIQITKYIKPDEDRSQLESEPMPRNILSPIEKSMLCLKDNDSNEYIYDEKTKFDLGLRDTDKISTAKLQYHRRNSL